ncbi:Gfo/Idh/MocA family protein [Carnimonas nigrificans]|uniref:Gfo/Idh/MocA family protein n=1 Tax=Carnimonas nigrificans TaxID=64323 RepID=UPI0004709241|nr:Gfo/Idh/MocA family oxidoreductase [Carnimonas nigrificans]
MQRLVNWGVLGGSADIARKSFMPAICAASNARPLALASRQSATDLAAQHGFERAYSDYTALLEDSDVEVVYLPLPNHLHAEWAIRAAEQGKHVVCEKPAALGVSEARTIIDACKANGVRFMEAFMYQFHPQHARVRELIRQGEIGTVQLINLRHSFYMPDDAHGFRLQSLEQGGGALYDIGCYCLHLSRQLLGEPSALCCLGELDNPFGCDLTSAGTLLFESGAVAHFDCSMKAPDRNSYEVVGSLGTLSVPTAFVPQPDGLGSVELTRKNGEVTRETFHCDHYLAGVEAFSAALLGEGELPTSPGDTLANERVLEACASSLINRRLVTFPTNV